MYLLLSRFLFFFFCSLSLFLHLFLFHHRSAELVSWRRGLANDRFVGFFKKPPFVYIGERLFLFHKNITLHCFYSMFLFYIYSYLLSLFLCFYFNWEKLCPLMGEGKKKIIGILFVNIFELFYLLNCIINWYWYIVRWNFWMK